MMDEAALLAMIEEKNPEELGPEECAALLEAARSSPAIARACRERILLEQRLGEVLGHPGLSVDAILARARGGGRAGRGSHVAFVYAVAISLLVALVAASWLLRPRSRDVAVVDASAQGGTARRDVVVAEKAPGGGDEADAAVPVVTLTPHEKPVQQKTAPESAPADEPAAVTDKKESVIPVAAAVPPAVLPPLPPEDPWLESLRAAATMPKGLVAFRPLLADPPTVEVVKRWFAAVPGSASSFGAHQRGGRPAGGFKGIVRLLAPLEPDTSLQLAIHDWNGFRIHAWQGERGATLSASGAAGPWAGYTTTRQGSKPVPHSYALAATDAGRMQRTNPASPARLELRYAAGLLTLSRGDVRILDVPMASAPNEIYFEGFAEIAEVALVPASPLPIATTRLGDRAASLTSAGTVWDRVLPEGVTETRLPDGRLVVEARDNKQPGRVMVRLPVGVPRGVVMQIDAFDPGTSVVAADAAGNPRLVLGFLANKHDKSLRQMEPIGAEGGQLEGDGRPHERPIAFVAPRTWVRFVHCGGALRVGTSPDGIHWAEFVHPGEVAAVGLLAAAHPSARRIVLGGVWAEPFPLVASLVPDGVRPPPSPLPGNVPLANWRQAAVALKPAAIDERDWIRACAVWQLGGSTSPELAMALLELVWQESLSRAWSVEQRFDVLAELAMLTPAWNQQQAAEIHTRYENFGLRLADEGVPRTYSLVLPQSLAAPLISGQPQQNFPAWLARRELMEAIVSRSGQVRETAARAQFYNLPGTPPVFAWAAATAQGVTPVLPPEPGRKKPKGQPRGRKGKGDGGLKYPLVLEATKEGISIAADIEAALSENALEDVGRALIGGLTLPPGELAPDVVDPDLTCSLPAFAVTLLHDNPRLQAAMAADFDDRGSLRLRQAVDSGDATILSAVATQYPGTPAAAEASLLLGDRELAAGRFAMARQRYAAARSGLPVRLASRLAVSDDLAAGLLGEAASSPAEGAVGIGTATLEAAVWNKLAAELRQERAAALPLGRAAKTGTSVASLPAARDYAPAPRSRLEGEVGHGPGEVPGEFRRPTPSSPLRELDWVARQVAAAVAGPRLLVSNRFQLASYDAQSGQLQWRAGLANEVGHAHAFAGQPMRPIASQTHAFVRRLRPAGPALAAIRLADGAVEWELQPRPNEWFVASDPIAVGDALLACTAQKATEGWTLSLATVDAAGGRLLGERTLSPMRDEWAAQGHDCQVAWAADGLAIACGGGLIACDSTGQIRWVRQEPWVPPAVDPLWRLQSPSPPLVADGRLYVVQPAEPAVTAIDATTGRAIWKRGFAGIRRVLGLVGTGDDRLLVAERSEGLVALSTRDGAIVWRHDVPELLDGCLVAAEGVLAVEQEPVTGTPAHRAVLVWLDPRGTVRRRSPLAGLEDQLPRVGPLVPAGDRLWTLFGRGPGDPTRDLVELTPK